MKRANPKKTLKQKRQEALNELGVTRAREDAIEKAIEDAKRQATADALDKTLLIFMAAACDTIGLTDDQMILLATTFDRYANHVDEHLVDMLKIQETIEKATGVKLKGWTE